MCLSVDTGEVNVLSVRSAFTVLAHTAVSVLMTDRVTYVLLKSSDHTVSYHYFPEVHLSRSLIVISKKHQLVFTAVLKMKSLSSFTHPQVVPNIDMYR